MLTIYSRETLSFRGNLQIMNHLNHWIIKIVSRIFIKNPLALSTGAVTKYGMIALFNPSGQHSHTTQLHFVPLKYAETLSSLSWRYKDSISRPNWIVYYKTNIFGVYMSACWRQYSQVMKKHPRPYTSIPAKASDCCVPTSPVWVCMFVWVPPNTIFTEMYM